MATPTAQQSQPRVLPGRRSAISAPTTPNTANGTASNASLTVTPPPSSMNQSPPPTPTTATAPEAQAVTAPNDGRRPAWTDGAPRPDQGWRAHCMASIIPVAVPDVTGPASRRPGDTAAITRPESPDRSGPGAHDRRTAPATR